MLLKCSQTEKRTKFNVNSKQQRSTGNMKLTVGSSPAPRLHRKIVKGFGNKRPIVVQSRVPVNGQEERTGVDPCDNSNDSGLGFDQHLDFATPRSTLRFTDQEPLWASEHPEVKRKRLEIKLESDDANGNYSFPETMNRQRKDSSEAGGTENAHPNVLRAMERRGPECLSAGRNAPLHRPNPALQRSQMRPQTRPTSAMMRRPATSTSLSSQLLGMSRDNKVHLQIVCQPEQQHRARYQTEGSRGAVKDRSGNGFPVVKLVGYNKPATLQVFIGTDVGKVFPHMFYQACRVSGKNSTPCVEKKIDGTVVIEVNFDPTKDMTITCDCVGILKERNVDVEHRFPDQTGTRNKKKSTRCRMVFRTAITQPDGSSEILQITSQPIVCTQPPGIPEICKKSLISCPCTGGMELFILGKNFLKDTRVIFQQNDLEPVWEETVQPDKEFLQQTHLVCTVPPYRCCDLIEPMMVKLFVMSSGKTSEPHNFTYTPANNSLLQPTVGTTDIPQPCLSLAQPSVTPGGVELERVFKSPLVPAPGLMVSSGSAKANSVIPGLQNQFLPSESSQSEEKKEVHPISLWASSALMNGSGKHEEKRSREVEANSVVGHKMMPPPPALLPIASRRASSTRIIIPDTDTNAIVAGLKTELVDESSQGANQLSPEDLTGIDLRMKPPMATVTDLMSTQSPSMATFRRFVSSSNDSPLPAQSGLSVENYLSRLEKPDSQNTAVTNSSASSLNSGNKIQNAGTLPDVKSLSSAFNAPSLMFQTTQQTTTAPGNEVPLTNIFSTASPREPIAASFVAGLGHEAQPKAEYGAVSTSPLVPPAVLTLPTVTESQLNNFPSATDSSTTRTSALSVPPIINNVVESTEMIQTAASLMFSDTQTITSKTLMSAQKPDDQLLERLTKAPSNSMHLEEASTAVSQHLLSVNQAGSTMMSVSSGERINALVSSAMENHMLNSGVVVDQKINALVNSAAESHLINHCSLPISPENTGLNSQTDTNRQTMQNLRLETSVSPTNNFHSPQQAVQMSPNGMLVSGTDSKMSPSVEAMVLDVNSAPNEASSHILLRNPTSPIAMKTMILNSAVSTSVDGQIMVHSPTRTSPIAVKSLILNSSPLEADLLLPSTNRTSPIAIKNMIVSSDPDDENMQVASTNSTVAVKNILNSSSINNIHLPPSDCTSPIAMKKLILESPAPMVNEIHPANPCTTLVSDNGLLAGPTMLATSSNNANMNLLSASTVPTPLVSGTQLQQGPLVITQAPSVPSTCSNTSITPAAAQELEQHITSMFGATNANSVGFTSMSNSIQPPSHAAPIVQAEHLTNTTCFTTADSNSQSLLTSTCVSANTENQCDGQDRFVNHVLMNLATSGEMKNQMETPMVTETNVPKTLQGPVSSSVKSNLPRILTKLDVTAQLQQQPVQESTSLPVPVTEISNGVPVTKEASVPNTTAATTPVVQKKNEEGMVPQELAQMSENDLISYINPSCFDQV